MLLLVAYVVETLSQCSKALCKIRGHKSLHFGPMHSLNKRDYSFSILMPARSVTWPQHDQDGRWRQYKKWHSYCTTCGNESFMPSNEKFLLERIVKAPPPASWFFLSQRIIELSSFTNKTENIYWTI